MTVDTIDVPTTEAPRRRRRWPRVVALLVPLLVLAIPIPWLHVVSDDPPGTAWRLDGRLEVNGTAIDPPGRWTWLAVGRPQLVGEVLYERLLGRPEQAVDLRAGSLTRRPALNEPAAAAVGLRRAGQDIPLGLLVEARLPLSGDYPDVAVITALNGIPLTDRQAWELAFSLLATGGTDGAADQLPPVLTFAISDGREFSAPGPGLPYGVVNTLDLAPSELQAGITFGLARLVPVGWFRNLSLGSSHGMMVALTTYAYASGQDLARGRHIAGTGGIIGDGTVTRIGGLPAKARAANRAGADVLFVPATQAGELEGMSLPGTTVVPIVTLDDAIAWLSMPTA